MQAADSGMLCGSHLSRHHVERLPATSGRKQKHPNNCSLKPLRNPMSEK
jgi:hypothetical protein